MKSKRKNVVEKIYNVAHLLSQKKVWELRIRAINNFDVISHPCIGETSITLSSEMIYYRQPFYERCPKYFDRVRLLELADALDYFVSIDFIHGDLNSKNIICTKDGYKIIDFEPDLFQVKNGVNQWMVTIPYIAKKDKEHNKITHLTDKVGFGYFVKRMKGTIGPKEIVDAKKHFNHEKYLSIPEDELEEMSFVSIANLLVLA